MPQFKSTTQMEQEQARREKIVEWMTSESMKDHRRDFNRGKTQGFSVNARYRVAKKNGDIMPVTEFLRQEGFEDGEVVGDYRIRFNPAEGDYPESYAFFLNAPVVEVPEF